MSTQVWELGDYPKVADDVIPDLGAVLAEACAVGSGMRVLDVACGSGNATLPAARSGAQVTGCDLSSAMLRVGAERAAAEGLGVDWREGDVQELPFADGAFDVVMSCVGAMFAPDHQRVADKLVRVCRAGGTVGMINWTQAGFIGRLLAATRPFAPAPPPGAVPPVRWGDEDYIRGRFGPAVADLRCERRFVHVDSFATPAEFRDEFKFFYGPFVAVYGAITGDDARIADLDAVIDGVAADANVGGPGDLVMDWEYLLVTATRADGHLG